MALTNSDILPSMKKESLALVTGALLLPALAQANDIKEDQENYTAPKASGAIVLDGDLSEWSAPKIENPMFTIEQGAGDAGEVVSYRTWPAGSTTWDGPADHTTESVQLVWDDENLYLGVVVTDDYHQNPGNGWNGDALQVHIANADRNVNVALYNYALTGAGDATTDPIIHHEKRPEGGPDTTVAITRSGTTTTYEVCFPKAALGIGELSDGVQLGVGFTVNDGDEAHPGQTGWGGWGPHSVVHGKSADQTGLVTLSATAPVPTVSEWGLITMGVLLLGVGIFVIGRRQRLATP